MLKTKLRMYRKAVVCWDLLSWWHINSYDVNTKIFSDTIKCRRKVWNLSEKKTQKFSKIIKLGIFDKKWYIYKMHIWV